MSYTFRLPKVRELERYRQHLIEAGHTGEEFTAAFQDAHVGILDKFRGTTPSYCGKVLIVFHQNVSMVDVYTFDKEGLEPVEIEQ